MEPSFRPIHEVVESHHEKQRSFGDKVKRAVSKRLRLYSRVFATEDGLDVLADLAKQSKLYEPTFEADPLIMAYRNGMRDFALYVINSAGQGRLNVDRRIREMDDGE